MPKKLARIIQSIVLVCVTSVCAWSQEQKPFLDEIKSFHHQDSLTPPPQHAILFVGSSSFRLWKDVQKNFPDYTIINRGFGGSTLPDVIRYADDIIFPYNPKQIVIYAGENDLASKEAPTPQQIADRFIVLFTLIRNKLTDVNIVYVAIKPSPSRQLLMPKEAEANALIKAFILKQKHVSFVDVYTKMLDANGEPMADIFREDKLHMNSKGYAIWKEAILPYLLK
jgi:lysophospholipase L1-like esterase